MGRVKSINKIDVEETSDWELLGNKMLIHTKFNADLTIEYLRPGDILFEAVLDPRKRHFSEHIIMSGVRSPFELLGTYIPDVTKCNICIEDIINSSPPRYSCIPAIYPNYSPIVCPTNTVEVETSFYPKATNTIDKNVLEYVDPLYDLPKAKRMSRIVADIQRFEFMTEKPGVSGLVDMFSGKSAVAKPAANICFVPLEKLEEEYKRLNSAKPLYVPSIPLDKKWVALLNTKSEHTDLDIKQFKHNVEEYINMKHMEAEAIKRMMKETSFKSLHALYAERRKDILK